MAELQVQGWGNGNAPLSRTTKDSEHFTMLALEATFDGTGAGGDFVPAVQILSDSGDEVGTFPLDGALSVGDAATVTFAPFLSSGGIRFDKTNVGGWLHVETNVDGGTPSRGIYMQSDTSVDLEAWGAAFDIKALGGNDLRLFADGFVLLTDGFSSQITIIGGDITIEPTTNHDAQVNLHTGGTLRVTDNASAPIFEVREDGTIHGLASVGAITWDL